MRLWVFQELPNALHVCVNYWFPLHAFRCLHVTWGLCLRPCPEFFLFWPGIESFKLISKFGVLDRYSNLLARVLKVLMELCVQFIWSAVAQRYNAGLAIKEARVRIPLCYRFEDWEFSLSPLTPQLTQLYKWVPGYWRWWKCEWVVIARNCGMAKALWAVQRTGYCAI